MSKVQGTSEKGFVLKEKNGSVTTYYSDGANVYASRLAYFGGNWSNSTNAGTFNFNVNHSTSDSNSNISTHLTFY